MTATTIFAVDQYETNEPKSIYVSVDGNDAFDGSNTHPFRTLKKAASEAKAGTTVYVKEGTYHEQLLITHSGTKSNPITFTNYKQDKVILSGKNINVNDDDTSLITIRDQDHITIRGFTIQDLTTNSTDETVMGIYVTGSSSHITLENNHVQRIRTLADDGNAHGIAIYGTGAMKNIRVIHNTVEKLILGASEAIVLNGNIDVFTIERNTVRNNNNIGIDLIGYEGVAKDKNADYVRNGTVVDNLVYNISSYGNPAYGHEYSAAGIYIDGGKDILLENNTVYESDIGIEATSEHKKKYAEQIEISNNRIYDNFYTGISIGGYDHRRGGTKDSTISHNILYRNDTKGLNGGQLLLQHDVTNNLIEKNTLTTSPSRIFIANYFTTNEGNVLKENVYDKEEGNHGIWIWKNKEYTRLSTFKTASHSDE